MVQSAAVGLTCAARRAVLTLALALAASGCATAPAHLARPAPAPAPAPVAAPVPKVDPAQALDRVFLEETRAEQSLDPLGALERGDPLEPAQFRLLFTPELVSRQRAVNAAMLARLDRIDRAALDDAHRISYDVFRDSMLEERDVLSPELQALLAVRPFNHFGGFHVEYAELAGAEDSPPLQTIDDFEARIALDRALPAVFGQVIARFREGIATGVVEPRLTVRNMIAQIDAILAQNVATSPFMAPVRHLPLAMARADRERMTREFTDTVKDSVYPAYRALRDFLAREYLPAARDEVGLSAMKGGAQLYRALVRIYTTLDLDPEQIHQLGLREVARIQREMEGVKRQLGFAGPLRAFFDHIRADPRYHPRNVDDLARGYRLVRARVDAQLPRYFLHLPRTSLEIEPYRAYRAKFEAGGSYSQGLPDGSRPGVFSYNTYDLKSRFLTGVTTLYLHEGVPGHHFQISLAQENEALPDFQRFGGNSAFVEGWALYAETLGFEMGLYDDPMQHWGTLDDEMLRAMRLVVDTGLHMRGWTRAQAIDYMLANSGMGRSDATAEVDRYIATPGQALAYKIGGLTIQHLRRKAETELGPRFDIRAFHDQVLGSGALPLPVLEDKIDRWIGRMKAQPASGQQPGSADLRANFQAP